MSHKANRTGRLENGEGMREQHGEKQVEGATSILWRKSPYGWCSSLVGDVPQQEGERSFLTLWYLWWVVVSLFNFFSGKMSFLHHSFVFTESRAETGLL